MKFILSLFSILFVLNFGFSQTKKEKKIRIKTIKTDSLIISYPKTWKKFGAIGHIFFTPKIIRRNTFENELEQVSVNKNFISLRSGESIEVTLNKYAETLNRFETKKNFKILKPSSNSKFIYKIESIITYSLNSDSYKKVEYFFKNGTKLESYSYQMREELFDLYFEDAMLIINSITKR